MSNKDGFDPDDFEDRTVIRPNPGGRLNKPPVAAPMAPPVTPAPQYEPASDIAGVIGGAPATPSDWLETPEASQAFQRLGAIPTTGATVASAAAAKLLMLAGQLANMAEFNAVQKLRDYIGVELTEFEKKCQAANLDRKTIKQCHYILCALLDDIVMSRPWGSASGWAQRSLVSVNHNEVTAGDKIYEIADQLEKSGSEPEVLDLLYLAFALGFEGRLRISARGPAELSQHRERLFRLYRQQFGSPERSLSAAWKGVEADHKPLRNLIPVWVYWAGFALLALLAFWTIRIMLNIQSDKALDGLKQHVSMSAPTLVRNAPPPVIVIADDPLPKIQSILQPDIDAGKVAVIDNGQTVMVRLINHGLFDSASATAASSYADTLQRVKQAVDLTKGPVLIAGYTDSDAIRTIQFPSNFDLSQARAKAIQSALTDLGLQGARVTTEGRADRDPLAPNTTPQGREQNRRIEIILQKTSEWN